MITVNSLQLPLEPGRRTAVALGCFDGIHTGHRQVIGAAVAQKALGYAPCVFTFTVQRPTAGFRKGQMMIQSLSRKLREMEMLGVEYVAVPDFSEFCGLTPEEFVRDILVERFHAGMVSCGFNFRFGKGAAGDAQMLRTLCAQHGVEVIVVPEAVMEERTVSSTAIREFVSAGDMPMAERFLGHPFTVDFEVVHGRELGRQMEYPTINQVFPPHFAVPRYGVYASIALVDGHWWPAVTNVGVKPTVGAQADPLAETHIRGLQTDLYGRRVEVSLLQFLRPEEKFADIGALRRQIAADTAEAVRIAQAYIAEKQLVGGLPGWEKFEK